MARILIRTVLAVVLSSGVAAALDGSRYLPGDPLSAARVFEQKRCIQCHLIDFGHEGFGPDLGRIPLSSNLYDIAGRMWNAAPEMVSKMELLGIDFPRMDPASMVNLLAFIGVYQNYLVNYSRRVRLEDGARLFREKKCVQCHSFDREANTVGPSLARFRTATSPLSVLRAMWLHSYYMRKAGKRMGVPWPVFSKGEIRGLLYYVISGGRQDEVPARYLRPGSARAGLDRVREYRCLDCHSIKGEGRRKAPDLAAILRDRDKDIYIIMEALWNHSPIMWDTFRKLGAPMPRLTTKDLADVISYLYFVNFDQPAEGMPPGEEIFAAKRCTRCHESAPEWRGSGNGGPGDKIELVTRLWNTIPDMLEQARADAVAWPTFHPGEMSALVDYLARRHPPSTADAAP